MHLQDANIYTNMDLKPHGHSSLDFLSSISNIVKKKVWAI